MRSAFVALFLAIAAANLASAASFPKPNPDRAFADLKVYDEAGRPWRAAREDWAGARQRVANDPAWADWLKRERTTVDAWMKTHRDRVEWVAGWSHDGISPKDGSRVTWTEKIPREVVQFFSSPSDPQIEITPKLFAWWVVSFRGRHVDTMERAARLFRLTGEARYADWVAQQMDFYADNYLKWEAPKPEQGARLFWQTLTEASNLVKFTEAVRLLGDRVPAAKRAGWADKFFRPEVAVINKNMQTIHNIATWQRCAAAQVALLLGDEAMWREAIDGKFGLRRQMADGITSDYLWHEQSLGYNNFVVRAVLSLFTAAGIQGRADELAAEMSTAENLMIAPTYLRFPDGRLPNPADSGSIGTAPNREVFADTYRVFPTTLGLEAVAGVRDWNILLDPPPAVSSSNGPPPPRAVVLPEVTSRSFETTRMALLKSGPWQVFVHYGQLTRSHAQAEALNYSAYFGTTDITHDSGTVGYGSPLYKGYYARGANHNVPLVNGEGQEPQHAGELINFSATPASVSVAQPHYRKDAAATRTLKIDGDRLVDVATVTCNGAAKKGLGFALQLQGKVKLPASFAAEKDFGTGSPEPFRYWRNVRSAAYTDRAEFDVAYGTTTMHVVLEAPGRFQLFHGSTPDVPPHRRETFYIQLAEPAASATFTTTFSPAR
ncbi:MAG: heparinase II/III family protein [Verrucomicrobia bacterium]|nr:heparinase II/III family protein [Verrucomicrobiota bacterium]